MNKSELFKQIMANAGQKHITSGTRGTSAPLLVSRPLMAKNLHVSALLSAPDKSIWEKMD
jgi:hypothetical protein